MILIRVNLYTGAESLTMPNVVMNSLISSTKVITNDTIPNPIAAAHMALPSIPVPVSSLGIPVMNMKTDDDEKPLSDVECGDAENDKDFNGSTKCDAEPMPVEDDNVLDKTDENCCETDIDVSDDSKVAGNGNHDDKSLLNSAAEPMECVSVGVTSFASPKHTMTTDIVMTESVSVSDIEFHIQLPFDGFFSFSPRHHRPAVCKWRVPIHHSRQTRKCMTSSTSMLGQVGEKSTN